MTTDLRLATAADVPAIESIVHAAYAPYIARIGRKPGPMLDDYAGLVGEGRVHVLALEGVVEGLVVLIPQDDAMLLDNIAVAPSGQGKGLGRRLLEFAEAAAREAGYGVITLYTNEMMVENVGLYGRVGYAETHRGEEQGFRRVYMRKSLVA
jgi:GNAT superfamily N-acetyltransferase